MHNCATFTAAVYINALQGNYSSGTATMPYSALFTTVEYYRAAW
jgi:hypothetical protein